MIFVSLRHFYLWTCHPLHRKYIKITLNMTTDLFIIMTRMKTCLWNYFIIHLHTSYTAPTETSNGIDNCTLMPHKYIPWCHNNSVVHYNKILFLYFNKKHRKITTKIVKRRNLPAPSVLSNIVYTYEFYHWPKHCYAICNCSEFLTCSWLTQWYIIYVSKNTMSIFCFLIYLSSYWYFIHGFIQPCGTFSVCNF